MSKAPSHQAECEHLLAVARGDIPLQRDMLINSIEKLFLNDESILSEKEQAIMADILRHLIRDIEATIRKNLADKLAKMHHPPQELVNILADDSIDVCYNLLVESPLLNDETLLHIIHHRGVQHQLAISIRRNLSSPVCDALVATKNGDVIAQLLENKTAQISEATLNYLAHESKRVTRYQRPLLHRADLNPELAKKMYWWVSASLRQHIIDHFAIDPNTLDDALEHAAEHATRETPSHDPAVVAYANALAAKLEENNQLTNDTLLTTLRSGEIPLFEAILCRMLKVRHELIIPLLYESELDNIAIAGRFLHLSNDGFHELITLLKLGLPHRFNTDTAIIEHYFAELKFTAAEAVIKTWRRDPNYLLSIAALQSPEGKRPPV
jgi:uncharacterized protein (DUF2336 family)